MTKFTLKAARVNVGLTQKKAAMILGVATETIRNWEKGKSFPRSKKHLDELCQMYGISYDDINFLPVKNA